MKKPRDPWRSPRLVVRNSVPSPLLAQFYRLRGANRQDHGLPTWTVVVGTQR